MNRRRAVGSLALLASIAVTACAGWQTPSVRDKGQRTTSKNNALLCDALQVTDSVVRVVGPGEARKIKFPESQAIAVLHIPVGAVSEPTTFVLKVETGMTRRALINIEARQGETKVTTFSRPLVLELHVRSGCEPSKPEPGSSFYIYTMKVADSPGDTTLTEGHGDYDDPPLWKFWKSRRVTSVLDHLSGYILAQG